MSHEHSAQPGLPLEGAEPERAPMEDREWPGVQGFCPMGCGETLFVGAGGFVTCSALECPRPDVATELLLAARESEHVVQVTEHGFLMEHPLRERAVEDGLFSCRLHRELVAQREAGPPPVGEGRFRVREVRAGESPVWSWERVGV